MNALVRLVFPLVAYVCVATVLSLGIGYGYLRNSGRLDDAAMFRIMAMLQGVDLEAIEKEGQASAEATPPEEQSFAEQQQLNHAAMLHYDAKQKQLADALNQFDYQLRQLSEQTARYDDLKKSVDLYLNNLEKEVTDGAREQVRQQVEKLIPKKQAKPLLIKMIDAGQLEEVIRLLNSMKPKNQQDILRTFDTPEDIDRLYRLQQQMLGGAPAKPFIDAQLEQLKKLNEQSK